MNLYLNQGASFYRQIIALILPIVTQNIVTTTVALADTFMVGLLGEASIAAVTLTNTPIFVLQLFIFGLQSGGAVLISQNWGKDNHDAIHRTVGVSMWIISTVGGYLPLYYSSFPTNS